MRLFSLTKAKTTECQNSPGSPTNEPSTPPPISRSRRNSRAVAAPPRRSSRPPPETMAISAYVVPSPPTSSHAPDAPMTDFFGNVYTWTTPPKVSLSSLSSIASIPSTIVSEIDCQDTQKNPSTADSLHSHQSSVSSAVTPKTRLIAIRRPVVYINNIPFKDQRHAKPGLAITSSTKLWGPDMSPPSSATSEADISIVKNAFKVESSVKQNMHDVVKFQEIAKISVVRGGLILVSRKDGY